MGRVSSPATDADRIAERYPKRGIGTPAVVAIGLIATALGIVWLVWAANHHANPTVAGQVTGFTVVSDSRATAKVTVQRGDTSRPGQCLVIAQARSFERVAEVTLDVPAGGAELTTFDVEMKTLKRATSVSVDHCRPI